jgi:hypothetical protein
MAVDIETLDDETYPQDLDSIADRVKRIYEAVQAVESAGLNPVIYANQTAWTKIAGGTAPTKGGLGNGGLPFGCLPLWNPSYDSTASLGTAFQPFGPWVQRVGKQYEENDTEFGVTDVDLNVFSLALLSGGTWGMALDESLANPHANAVISVGGFRLNHATNQFIQNVTITNASSNSIPGPISFALDGLSSNATLVGALGSTSCTIPAGSVFLNIQQGSLASGQSVTATLQFLNPTNQAISYSPRVLAGSGTR